jgi:hypothetical protein
MSDGRASARSEEDLVSGSGPERGAARPPVEVVVEFPDDIPGLPDQASVHETIEADGPGEVPENSEVQAMRLRRWGY